MTDRGAADPPEPSERLPEYRLDSWKEIAAHFRRDVTTVQRWERREGMPVHRHLHDKQGSVHALRSELDAWARSRQGVRIIEGVRRPQADVDRPERPHAITDDADHGQEPQEADAANGRGAGGSLRPLHRRPWVWLAGATGGLLTVWLAIWLAPRDSSSRDLLTNARFLQLTDFSGNEQAAAVSRDGKFVAFLSDRDGEMDVWVSQVGTGLFYNLTRGRVRELVNPSVRTLGFSPDGALVTFWVRRSDGSSQTDVSIWAVPVLGGPTRPYLEGVAEFDWSPDGTGLVYHTPGPGDPMFVRDAGQPEPRQIFSAPPGLHCHFPVWSPDRAFIYFVQGALPDRMDVWRTPPTAGTPERITNHDAHVSHPVFLDRRTLLYLATDADGSGPWIHSLDVERRQAHRVSFGLERYTSLAASGDGRTLVATVETQRGALWRLPLSGERVESSSAERIPLPTGNGASPRVGAGYLLYVSSKGASDSLWKLQGGVATELWSAPARRIIGGPAIARDGLRIAFTSRQDRHTSLHVVNADGTNAHVVTSSLELQGGPAWEPDGRSITVSAVVDGATRLFNVPLDGRPPAAFVAEHSADPAWSPDGEVVLYSGPDIGTTFSVKAVAADGSARPLPALTLGRGSRHLAFLPGGRTLVVLRGEIGHKDLWLIDLATGAERQLTHFDPAFNVRDFDISPDGREIVVEEVQEHSDIVLIQVPRR